MVEEAGRGSSPAPFSSVVGKLLDDHWFQEGVRTLIPSAFGLSDRSGESGGPRRRGSRKKIDGTPRSKTKTALKYDDRHDVRKISGLKTSGAALSSASCDGRVAGRPGWHESDS